MLKAAFRSVEIAFTFVYRTVIFVQDGGKSLFPKFRREATDVFFKACSKISRCAEPYHRANF